MYMYDMLCACEYVSGSVSTTENRDMEVNEKISQDTDGILNLGFML